MSLFGLPDRLLAPAPAEGRIAFLRGKRFAHRGLHGGTVVENSRSAALAAVKAGYGIECDVRMSRDGVAVVFHDADLQRLTGRAGGVRSMPAADLVRIALSGGADRIMRLDELLGLIGGRVPLLIEIKADGRKVGHDCLCVRRALEGYRGPVAVMSFNPEVGRWFAMNARHLTRGLVLSDQHRGFPRGVIERQLSLWRAKPDFLAYDVRDLPSRFAARQRGRGLPVLTWTVDAPEKEATAAEHADAPIFEQAP